MGAESASRAHATPFPQAEFGGVLAHAVHLMPAIALAADVHRNRKWGSLRYAAVYFFTSCVMDLIGIYRSWGRMRNIVVFTWLNWFSFLHATVGLPFLACQFHMYLNDDVRTGIAHCFLTVLPYLVVKQRMYHPLYDVSRVTIAIVCISIALLHVGKNEALGFYGAICLLFASEIVGTSCDTICMVSRYHWFLVCQGIANLMFVAEFCGYRMQLASSSFLKC